MVVLEEMVDLAEDLVLVAEMVLVAFLVWEVLEMVWEVETVETVDPDLEVVEEAEEDLAADLVLVVALPVWEDMVVVPEMAVTKHTCQLVYLLSHLDPNKYASLSIIYLSMRYLFLHNDAQFLDDCDYLF